MDFNVSSQVVVDRLGIFDDLSNGFHSNTPISVAIFDRNTMLPVSQTLTFSRTQPGTLIDGSRFQQLSAPLTLSPGFQGAIVAWGFNNEERNGNSGGGAPAWTTDSGGGALSFVGLARFGFTPGAYPGNPDGGPFNRYAAGTFEFHSPTEFPLQHVKAENEIAYIVPAGTAGGQNFGGSLGMDFNVVNPLGIDIKDLGVFDDNSDGLMTTITAHIYDRTNTVAPIATLVFTPGDPGTLIGGSRFKPLADPLFLPQGFMGTIVAEGYNSAERNGNGFGADPVWFNSSGFGAIEFVGGGRFGTAGLYPGGGDGGPVNRYAAGTFRFDAVGPVPEPASLSLLIIGGAALLRRRSRRAA